jgi:hypothetical protein
MLPIRLASNVVPRLSVGRLRPSHGDPKWATLLLARAHLSQEADLPRAQRQPAQTLHLPVGQCYQLVAC